MTRFASLARAAVIGLGSLAAACGSSSGPNPAGNDAAVADDGSNTFAGCVGDPRSDVFAQGMTKMGFGSRLQLRLLSAQPGPPIKGTNTWMVEVDDPAGAAQAGAMVKVTTYMPDHGHSSPVAAVATAQPTTGQYQITPLYFFMAGLWQVSIDVTTSAGVNDVTMFSFCVDH